MPTEEEVQFLADAMWQLLDDMGKSGQNVCLMAKAEARLAFEPFRDPADDAFDDWMTLDEANQVVNDVESYVPRS